MARGTQLARSWGPFVRLIQTNRGRNWIWIWECEGDVDAVQLGELMGRDICLSLEMVWA